MDGLQNLTTSQTATDASSNAAANDKIITPQQQMWIDFCALSGIVTDLTEERPGKDGIPVSIRKMPVREFAEKVGVSRQTLYEWRNSIPNFWGLVNDRRKELGKESRLARVHETWYLKAVRGEFQHMQLWLANFDPSFRMPTEKVQHELADSWQALINKKQLDKNAAVEGEVVEQTNNG